MQLSEEQFEVIEHLLPRQRGNVRISNLQVLNGILHVAVNGCTWRALPERYGRWHTVYTRFSRWAKAGVIDRIFEELQVLNFLKIEIQAVALDSTSVKVHPDGTGALKKGALKPSAGAAADSTPKFIWLPRASSRS
jgi:transposase